MWSETMETMYDIIKKGVCRKYDIFFQHDQRTGEIKMVTIKEIARECNVSPTTVSNILNGRPNVGEETKKRVLEVVRKRGYQPNYIARGLRIQKTRMIGIIVEDLVQFSTAGVVDGIMEQCEKLGYRTIVQNLRLYSRWSDAWFDDENAYYSILNPALQEVRQIQADGVIYVAGHERYIRCFPEDFSLPAVMSYAYEKSGTIPSVVLDDERGGYEITRYLISMGHQKIGVIAGKEDNIHTQKRLLGYQRALYEEKLFFNPDVVCYGKWKRESGYQMTGKLLEAGVSAIFCMADQMAGGVYDYLEEHGLKAGKDLAVVGFDNQDMAEYFSPPLTTMKLPLREIGKKAAEILLTELEGETCRETQKEIKIPCSLIVRDSVIKLKC